jgi:tetratricopeptide (TPR) repeat protein
MRAASAAWLVLLLMTRAVPAQPLASKAAASHVGKAAQLMQDRLFKEAAAEFEQALAADPNNDAVRIQYATCLFAQERDDEARKQFEIERQKLGDKPGLNYFLGRLDLRANQFASAITKLKPLEHDPALSKVSFYLGLAYLSAGQQARALECLERAAKDYPDDPDVHYRLGRIYSMAGRTEDASREYGLYKHWDETQRVSEQAAQDCTDSLRTQPIVQARLVCQPIADPKDARSLLLLGQLYSQHGAFSDAVEPLQQAVKLEPESFEAWNSLGLALFRLMRYRDALPPLEKASSLNPQFFGTLSLLASTLHMLGNDTAALPVLEKAHNLNPDDAQVTTELAQLHAKLKGKQ